MQAQGMWSAGEGDDNERFLADLRALRDRAALEFGELAARAHYPSDVLKEAESGPSLPGLPILAAYVRACDGDVPEWEERWRRLGLGPRADPSLPVRPAGASPAALAGARAGVSVAPPDAYDPERIRAALRGSHRGSDRGGRGAAARNQGVPESPASWSGETSWDETRRWDAERGAEAVAGWDAGVQPGPGTSWDASVEPGPTTSWDGFRRDADARWDGAAADLASPSANGNHHVSQPGDGSPDAAVIEAPDAARAEAIRRDPFSADWLQDRVPASPPDTESGRADRAEAEPPAADPDSWFAPRETAGREQDWPAADTDPSPAAADAWFTPRERADSEPAPSPGEPPQEHAASAAAELVTGFWTPSAASSTPAEAQRPGPSPAEGHTIARASWSAPAETPASDAPTAAGRTIPMPTPASAAAPPRTITGPAVPPGPVVPPGQRRADRLYPVRLLVVIMVAALIGSILVLILR